MKRILTVEIYTVIIYTVIKGRLKKGRRSFKSFYENIFHNLSNSSINGLTNECWLVTITWSKFPKNADIVQFILPVTTRSLSTIRNLWCIRLSSYANLIATPETQIISKKELMLFMINDYIQLQIPIITVVIKRNRLRSTIRAQTSIYYYSNKYTSFMSVHDCVW